MKIYLYVIAFLALFMAKSRAQWNLIDSITSGNINSINFINADTGFVYNQPGIVWRTANGGQSWDSIPLNFTGYIKDMDFASSSVGYAVGGAYFPHGVHYPYAIFKTTDGGLTWDSIFSGGNGSAGVFTHVATLSDNEFFATSISGMLHSDDGGQTFDTASVSNLPFGMEQYSRVRFLNANKGYVLGRSNSFIGNLQNVYETNNGGQTWQSIHADSAYNFSLDFVMTPSGNGLIVGNDSYVLRTVNGGNNWDTVPLTNAGLLLTQIEEAGGHLYALGSNGLDTSSGIYHSSDWGTTWQKQFFISQSGGGLQDLSIPTAGTGYAVSYIKVYKNSNLISLPETLRGSFELYPNPASGMVSLKLPEPGVAKVVVYNAVGQRVMEFSTDGKPGVSFDVSSLQSGFYLLEVRQDGAISIRRLLKE